MSEAESEGHGGGRGNPSPSNDGAFGVKLTGPVANLLSLENIHPAHDYDDDLSATIYETYNTYIKHRPYEYFTHIEKYATNSFMFTSIRDIFYSKDSNKITILLNIEFSLKLMNAVIKDLCEYCQVPIHNLIAFFSWPLERPRPGSSGNDGTVDLLDQETPTLNIDIVTPKTFSIFPEEISWISNARAKSKRINPYFDIMSPKEKDDDPSKYFYTMEAFSFLMSDWLEHKVEDSSTLLDLDEMQFSCLIHCDEGIDDNNQLKSENYSDLFESEQNNYYDALQEYLSIVDCCIYCLNMNEKGSFFKELKAIYKDRVTRETIERKMQLLEDTMTSVALLKGEIPIEEHSAKIASTFLSRVSKKKRAIVLIGSILILKFENDDETSTIITRRISPEQIELLFQFPKSLKDPEAALDVLAGYTSPERPDTTISPFPRVLAEPFIKFTPRAYTYFASHPATTGFLAKTERQREDDERG